MFNNSSNSFIHLLKNIQSIGYFISFCVLIESNFSLAHLFIFYNWHYMQIEYIYIYLFCLGLECRDVIGWNASRGCLTNFFKRQASKFIAQHGGRNVIWTDFLHKRLFTYQTLGPRQNKTLIRFVTDCLQKFVGSVKPIEGEADFPRHLFVQTLDAIVGS